MDFEVIYSGNGIQISCWWAAIWRSKMGGMQILHFPMNI